MKNPWDTPPPITPDSPLFPGDTAYSQRWTAQIGPGCPVNLSAITMSPHIGAHADAPLHYGAAAPSIGQVDLAPYLGPCRVIHAVGCGPLIWPEHLIHATTDLPTRVLLRTCMQAPTRWSPAFSAFAPAPLACLLSRSALRAPARSRSNRHGGLLVPVGYGRAP